MKTLFVRNTHREDGTYIPRKKEIPNDGHGAGFVIHMLESDKPMSFDEVKAACKKYQEDYPDSYEYSEADIGLALIQLLDLGYAKPVYF